MGWIGPLMKEGGLRHRSRAQPLRPVLVGNAPEGRPHPPVTPGALSGQHDVRLRPEWKSTLTDHYERATDPDDKTAVS
jgi:hypothetical protein